MKLNYRSLFELKGKCAVVTGGAGYLGQEFCRGLASFGAKVAVVDLDGKALRRFAARMQTDYGIACLGVEADVSDPDSVKAMTKRVQKAFGYIDILLNNAASKSLDKASFYNRTENYTLASWRDVMSVNIDGMFLVAQSVGGVMAKQKSGGSIIQTSSIYGSMAPDQRIYEGSNNSPAVYSASKAAVIGLTKYLAAEWANKGIRVNALSPGGIEQGQDPAFIRRYSARVPLGRMGVASELVGAVIFLSSEASSYVTGQNILVDGGLSAW